MRKMIDAPAAAIAAQQARMSFVLCADAVQTKNNPTGLFD